jgi:hypothetical protein
VYDMYPWDRPVAPARGPAGAADPATRAVQVALDRRDNGGAAAATPEPPASTAAQPAPSAGTDASPPTRQ